MSRGTPLVPSEGSEDARVRSARRSLRF
uniref:Uncharacterized protein n=1 Tax=Anguilla anguilla TaxID=7936 RepID=A0A0E9TWV0_ANGAN